jgi:hypothetical protein
MSVNAFPFALRFVSTSRKRYKTLYCECQQTDRDFFFVNCLSLCVEWRNDFYDPKLILKHIIWIHFTMHSFMPPDTCVEGERERARARRFVLLFLCLSYAANVYGI